MWVSLTDVLDIISNLSRKFPPSSIKDQTVFLKSDTKTFCPWKGEAEYYTIKHGGE